MSLSMIEIKCGAFSTIETSIVYSDKFSAISTPIYPPPTITALFGLLFSINVFTFSASFTFLIVKILSLFTPLNGLIGSAPGDNTNLS